MGIFGIFFIAMAVGCLLVLGPGFIAAVVAHRKGYRPWFWVLSCGLVGLVVTAVMPPIRRAETPELRERWETRADWTGGILSGITFMLMFVFPIMGGLFFVGVTAPMGRPAALLAPPPTVPPPITVEPEVLDVDKMEPAPAEADGKSE